MEVFKVLLTLEILSLGCYAKVYRFDYEWNAEAGGWLKYHAVPGTWEEARQRCHAEGAVLASPLSSQLKDAVVAFVKKSRQSQANTNIFTGVHAMFSKGDYASMEGVPLLRLAITWAPGEPDNYKNSESCLSMGTDGFMADSRCDRTWSYVCYKKDTSLVMTECGTTDLGYVLDHTTGSCYKVHTSGLLWSQAYMTCVAEGGYLAIINDDREAQAIKEIVAKHPRNTIFSNFTASFMIGIHDWGNRGRSFMTIHGQPLEAVFNKWAKDQPSSPWRSGKGSDDQRQFAVRFLTSGFLADTPTNLPLAFLCEKNPSSLR